jgi:hypothetical protein
MRRKPYNTIVLALVEDSILNVNNDLLPFHFHMSPSSDIASAMLAFFSVAWGVYLAKMFIEKWALKSSASQDFRRSGEGTSYSNGGPSYTYERPHHHDARPPYTSNDNRPMYSNGRIPHYRGDFSTEENDRAIALALSEEDHSEFIIPNHFCFCFVLFCFFWYCTRFPAIAYLEV